MRNDWPGLHFQIAERPTNPVDMGVAIDPAGAVVLWSVDADDVAHIELLSAGYPREGASDA